MVARQRLRIGCTRGRIVTIHGETPTFVAPVMAPGLDDRCREGAAEHSDHQNGPSMSPQWRQR